MKKEQLQKLIQNNTKEGGEIDWDAVHQGVNDAINDTVKAETERTQEKTRQQVLSEAGLESVDDVKTLRQELEQAKQSESEKLENLQKEKQELSEQLQEKDNQLTSIQQKEQLKGFNIKEDKVDKALRLIQSEVSDDQDFETAAKKFVEETPEWVDGKPQVDSGSDEGENEEGKETDADALAAAWD